MLDAYRKTVAVLERFPLSILQFLFRLGIATVFWNSGVVKIQSWAPTVALFANEYKVPWISPELAAMMATAVELTCPILLVLGLATRLATIPMLGVTFVIQTFVYPDLWHLHLAWATTLVFILTKGPGAISLDYLIEDYVHRSVADSRLRRNENPTRI